MILTYLDQLAGRAVVALMDIVYTLEAAMADEPVATPPAKKPKRRYRRHAPGSIHPDQCPWCLGFDARTADLRAAMAAWRRMYPSSQRVACKGWRRCRFAGPPKPGPQPPMDVTRRNSASFATVGDLMAELRRFDRGTPVRACAHIDGVVHEFEVGSLFVSSGDGDVAIMGYGPRRKGES